MPDELVLKVYRLDRSDVDAGYCCGICQHYIGWDHNGHVINNMGVHRLFEQETAVRNGYSCRFCGNHFFNMQEMNIHLNNHQLGKAVEMTKEFELRMADVFIKRKMFVVLFSGIVPETTAFFRRLCFGGIGTAGQPVGLAGSKLSEFDGFSIVCGGTNALMLYQEGYKHENSGMLHDQIGLLTMPKDGEFGKFRITTRPAPELNNTSIIFGKVYAGLNHIHTIASYAVDNLITADVTINCISDVPGNYV